MLNDRPAVLLGPIAFLGAHAASATPDAFCPCDRLTLNISVSRRGLRRVGARRGGTASSRAAENLAPRPIETVPCRGFERPHFCVLCTGLIACAKPGSTYAERRLRRQQDGAHVHRLAADAEPSEAARPA